MSLVEQELRTLLAHLGAPPVSMGLVLVVTLALRNGYPSHGGDSTTFQVTISH
jgi:hypothetical protein